MGLTSQLDRSDRFIKAFEELAIERMGIKSSSLISQSLGFSEDLEKVFFFVRIKTDDTAVELMYPEPIFDPALMKDDYDVGSVCAAFQMDDEIKVRELMHKAGLIDGKTSETQERA